MTTHHPGPASSAAPDFPLAATLLEQAGVTAADIEHCLRVAGDLDARFADPDLTRAALFHCLPTDALGGLPGFSDGARRILAGWRTLYDIAPDDNAGNDRDYSGDLRALVLIIFDLLDRLDPRGDLRRWVRSFANDGCRLAHPLPSLAASEQGFLLRVDNVIAPLARAHGFWLESFALRSAVSYHRDRDRWDRISRFVATVASAGDAPERQVAIVRETLGASTEPWRVRWEWRNLVTISRNLESFRETEWPRALFLCGFVSVSCTHPSRCYQLLERLHSEHDYRRRELSDFLGSASTSGYRAIHSKLVVPDPALGTLTVAVHLVIADQGATRHEYADAARLAELQRRQSRSGDTSLCIYTPTGDRKWLPFGATVLDFARSIHDEFLVLTKHAVINRTHQVGLLHRLSVGDTVFLVKADTPTPLPEGWQDAVPEVSREAIGEAHRRAWQSLLAKEGLRCSKIRLGRPELDDRLPRVLVDLATQEWAAEGIAGQERTPDWWSAQIALYLGQLRPPPGVVPAVLSEAESLDLVERVERKASELLNVKLGGAIGAPPQVKGRVGDFHLCTVCKPEQDSKLAAAIIETEGGTTLAVHRLGEPCAAGGIPLPREDHLTLDQFFVVETNNSPGVALDVLRVFQHEGVDMVEVVGRRLGPSWGVLRMEVDPVGSALIERLCERLQALDAVHRVISPLHRRSALLEAALPQRQVVARNPFYKPYPYVAGPVTVEDHLFYGRKQELDYLQDLLSRAQSPDADGGSMGFVNGPLRIGKTSLVRRFALLLRRQPEARTAPAYVKARRDESWTRLRRRLDVQLDKALQEAAQLWGVEAPAGIATGALEERIEAATMLPGRPSVVLVVDEVHRLFGACSDHEGDLAGIGSFRDFVERTPGVLVLWTGPTYGARTFHRELTAILLSSQPLPVAPFTFEQAKALLEARKLAIYHDISIDHGLVRDMYELTGGEPLWLAHLANLMWLYASQTSSQVVRFDHALLNRAKHDLLERSHIFATRIEPHGSTRSQSDPWRVAAVLAGAQWGEAGPDWGLTPEALAEQMRAASDPMPTHEVAQALRILHERGAALPTDGAHQRWRIAFPLLVEYLVRQASQGTEE